MTVRTIIRIACVRYIFALLTFALIAAAQGSTVAVVSSASYLPGIAPDSLASLFGDTLASESGAATLDSEQQLPFELHGVKLWVGEIPARLLYVSPGQVNFVVPTDVPLGVVDVRIESPTGTKATTAAVSKVAPAVFFVDALRSNRGALLNGSTYLLEPFSGLTTVGGGELINTRISLYGTGWRYAGEGGVNNQPRVIATDESGTETVLPVEYAGAAPGFSGLDQLNAVIPDSLRHLGLISVVVEIGNRKSNPVSFVMNDAQDWKGALPTLREQLVESGNESVTLVSPVDVSWSADGNSYIADPGAHAVFRLDNAGRLHRFAGSGASGDSGDGAQAATALLRAPVAVHADDFGNVYIVDRESNRVRVVGPDGVIRAFAGNGSASYFGDGDRALFAGLNRPSDVLKLADGTVLIADTENHRLRAVSVDGRIQSVVGTGEAGVALSGGLGLCAPLSSPTSLAVGIDGTVFILEGGNQRVLRLLPGGQLLSLGGSGIGGECEECGVEDLPISTLSRLATDSAGRLYVSNPDQGRIYSIDSAGVAREFPGNLAGLGEAESSFDAGIGSPLGFNLRLDGSLLLADASANTVRLFTEDRVSGCADVTSVLFDRSIAVAGENLRGTVHLGCPAVEPTTVNLSSSSAFLSVPLSLTVEAGADTVSFETIVGNVDAWEVVRVFEDGSDVELGRVRIDPAHDDTLLSLDVNRNTLLAGQGMLAKVTLGRPAGAGGVPLNLSSTGLLLDSVLTIPEGALSATFSVFVPANHPSGSTQLTVRHAGESLATSLALIAAADCVDCACAASTGPGSGSIGSFTLNPASVSTETDGTGTITLLEPAGPGGVLISIATNNAAVSAPSSIIILSGESTGSFPLSFAPVSETTQVIVTVSSENSVNATLTLNVVEPSRVALADFTVEPGSVTGGASATATVSLASPAPANGALVEFASDNPAATVPVQAIVSSGETTISVAVQTTVVGSDQAASISASSAGSLSANLTILHPGAGQGTIGSLSVSPNPVISGGGASGTVSLAAPAPAGGVLVTLASNNANASVPGSVVIPEGETQGTFAVTTTAVGSGQTATITATSANVLTTDLTLNPPGAGQGTIGSLSVSPNPVTSGGGATGTVSLAAPAPAGGVLVTLGSNNANASVPASLVIPEGETQGTFAVTTTAVGSGQTATIAATSANVLTTDLTLNPPSAGQGTIGAFGVSPNPVTSGGSASGTVTLAAPAPAGGILVTLGSNNANASVPASLVIPEGETQGTFAVTTTAVGSGETATIAATSANVLTTDLTLNPPPPAQGNIASFTVAPGTVTGGSSATGTVVLGAPASPGGVVVTLSSNNLAATVPASITVGAGEVQTTFAVQTSVVSMIQAVSITASSANVVGASLTVDVANPCVNGLDLNVNITNLLTGGGTLGAVVTLDGPAPSGGRTIQLVGVDGTVGQVFVAEGETQGSVELNVANLLVLLGSTLQAVLGDCPGVSATISADVPILGSLQVPVSLSLGSQGSGTVTLYEPAPAGGATVNLAASRTGLLATLLSILVNVDMPTSVTIPEGQISANFDFSTSLLGILPLGLDNLLGGIHIDASLVRSESGDVAITKN